ncbi:MAG TPA: hypothetical protein VMR06_16430 [Dokdonella sp.]|uniref:hypothetical protein n=1 Tax=Dokdonella sp. TaxID=2291710 RepID=UPI002BC126B3|nr:hypothetical protein [Dokdonella sp.]HUD43577.1 hypothetical protein [Dokdonella sp.]
MRILRIAALLVLPALLGGCSDAPPAPGPSFADEAEHNRTAAVALARELLARL